MCTVPLFKESKLPSGSSAWNSTFGMLKMLGMKDGNPIEVGRNLGDWVVIWWKEASNGNPILVLV